MQPIASQEIKPSQIVIVTATSGISQGLVGRLFKVLAVDYPYGVLLWLESPVQTRHTEDLRELSFAIPSQEYVDAICPDESWPEVID